MGAPDNPGDEQNHDITPPPSYALPMHGDVTDDDSDSDFQDIPYAQEMEATDDNLSDPFPNAGYQLLGSEGNIHGPIGSDDEDDEEMEHELNGHPTTEDPNLPGTSTVETEVLCGVWNAPRPAELDYVIDAKKSEEIKSVMSNVSLKLENIIPPQWAQSIPENKWIEDLLQEVRRHRNDTTANGK